MNSKIITGMLVIITLVIPCFQGKGMAIGEFALGLNAGLTYDPNNLENLTTRYNMAMKEYDESFGADSVNQIKVPYSPVFGFNIRYQFNFFFFRIGSHYTTPLQTINGGITPTGGVKNKIKIETSQVSFPATIGLLVPLSTRTHFFIGGGISYNQADITIMQSNPEQGAYNLKTGIDQSLSDNKRDRYSAAFVGYHFMIGAEIPVHEKFTLSVEWVHQEGRSHPIDNDGTDKAGVAEETPRKTLDVRGDFLIFGLNYYISF